MARTDIRRVLEANQLAFIDSLPCSALSSAAVVSRTSLKLHGPDASAIPLVNAGIYTLLVEQLVRLTASPFVH